MELNDYRMQSILAVLDNLDAVKTVPERVLKETNIGRLINKLGRHANAKVQDQATTIRRGKCPEARRGKCRMGGTGFRTGTITARESLEFDFLL